MSHFHQLTMVKQTAYILDQNRDVPKNKKWKDITINSHQNCLEDKKAFAANFKLVEQESNKVVANRIIQNISEKTSDNKSSFSNNDRKGD